MKISIIGRVLGMTVVLLMLVTLLPADVLTTTLAPLPDYVSGGTSEPRLDVITLEPATGGSWDLVGKPGDTLGWGFKITWSSNAGDRISFLGSRLSGYPLNTLQSSYTDRIGEMGGTDGHYVLAGTTWESVFAPAGQGTGVLALNAVPDTTYTGDLVLSFTVFDMSGSEPLLLRVFDVSVPVSIAVVPPVPKSQTITFPPLAATPLTASPFTVTVSASSALPVTVRSLQPDLCSVSEDGVLTLFAAGTCTLVAEQPGNAFFAAAPVVAQTFEITKSTATVTLQGNLNATYDGTDKTLTATTSPAGLPLRLLYNGESMLPRLPGIYVVDAIIDSPLHEGHAQAQMVITDTSPAPLAAYADWLLQHFTPQEIQAGLVTPHTADLTADGTPNLLKYAFGLDPWTTMSPEARAALPRFAGTGGANALVFSLPVTPSGDLIIKVEASSDLVTWTEIARRTRGGPWTGSASVFTGTPDESGTRAETLVSEPATPVYTSRFYRLNLDFAP